MKDSDRSFSRNVKTSIKRVLSVTILTLILAISETVIVYAQDVSIEHDIMVELVGSETTDNLSLPSPSYNGNALNSDLDKEIFSNFKKVDKWRMFDVIDRGDVKGLVYSDINIYMVTVHDKRYVLSGIDNDVIAYAQLHGIEAVKVNISDMGVVTASTPVVTTNNIGTTTGTGVTQQAHTLRTIFITLGIFFAIYVYRSFRMKKIQAVNTTSLLSSLDSSKVSKHVDTPAIFKNNTDDTTKKGVPKVRFSDVEGIDGLKEDVYRIVDFMKNPGKYQNMGARTPKGIILYGPPGTGKTLLAKAIAGESGVPFISAVGSDFIEKYAGVGAKRVRDLYAKAKGMAPCIVFIDEVDAVAGRREANENATESNQTINALLSELDGFSGETRVVTICATNRLDILDSAFMRAGRFDLKLAVSLPDKKSRTKILQIHGANKKLGEDVSFDALAGKTVGFSGAELEALLNEAAMLAAGMDKSCISNAEIEEAFFKIVMQGNKKKREEITETNKIIAWHEAGHTLATKLLTTDDVNSVTIIGSSSGAGGVTFRNPKEEELHSKKYLRGLVGVMYAGRAAEEIYLGDPDLITTGASQDIKQATAVIKQYLALNGMGELGLLDMTQLKADFADIVKEAGNLSKDIYAKTKALLTEHFETLKDLAETLLDKETLEQEEIDTIINKHEGIVTGVDLVKQCEVAAI